MQTTFLSEGDMKQAGPRRVKGTQCLVFSRGAGGNSGGISRRCQTVGRSTSYQSPL